MVPTKRSATGIVDSNGASLSAVFCAVESSRNATASSLSGRRITETTVGGMTR